MSLAAVPVVAQPIGRPEPVAPSETSARQVEATVRAFVANLNGPNIYFSAVDKVAGVRDYGYFGGPQWGESWAKRRRTARIEVEKVEVFDVAATTANARVSYYWMNAQLGRRSATISETLKLRIGAPPNFAEKTRWQIVAPPLANPENQIAAKPNVDAKNSLKALYNTPVLSEVAQKIADPKASAQQASRAEGEESLSNLRQLGLAALQFAQDYDEKFALAPEFFEEALLPYSHKPEIARIPATGALYTFNGNLSGQSSTNNQFPGVGATGQPVAASRVVMFYEGHNEQPVFRYSGRAAILFVDGHAALVSLDEAKSLIWKP